MGCASCMCDTQANCEGAGSTWNIGTCGGGGESSLQDDTWCVRSSFGELPIVAKDALVLPLDEVRAPCASRRASHASCARRLPFRRVRRARARASSARRLLFFRGLEERGGRRLPRSRRGGWFSPRSRRRWLSRHGGGSRHGNGLLGGGGVPSRRPTISFHPPHSDTTCHSSPCIAPLLLRFLDELGGNLSSCGDRADRIQDMGEARYDRTVTHRCSDALVLPLR